MMVSKLLGRDAPVDGGESRAAKRIRVDYDHCSYCGACVAVCPPDSITLHDATLLIENSSCTRCERCIPVCPTGALTLESKA